MWTTGFYRKMMTRHMVGFPHIEVFVKIYRRQSPAISVFWANLELLLAAIRWKGHLFIGSWLTPQPKGVGYCDDHHCQAVGEFSTSSPGVWVKLPC